MEELLNKYINYLRVERNASPLTMRNYTNDIHDFFRFLKLEKVELLTEVDRTLLRRYLTWLAAQGIVKASVARKLSAVRSFYRYLVREKVVTINPLSTFSSPKQGQRLPSFLTQQEMSHLLQAPDTSTPQGQRARAILELLYASGLRVSELVGVNLNDIDWRSREIRVWGKGAKERVVLMGKPAATAMTHYLRHGRGRLVGKRKSEALFVNRNGGRLSHRAVQEVIRKYGQQAGLKKQVSPHVLRHSFATHMLDGGADLRTVQQLLGHTNLATTQIYTHVTQSQVQRTYLDAFYNQLGELDENSDHSRTKP